MTKTARRKIDAGAEGEDCLEALREQSMVADLSTLRSSPEPDHPNQRTLLSATRRSATPLLR